MSLDMFVDITSFIPNSRYYGENAARLIPGDLLMICCNNYSYMYELFNGNIVQVAACQPDHEVESRNVRVKLGKDRIASVELRFRKATIKFAVSGHPVELSVMLLDNFLDERECIVIRFFTIHFLFCALRFRYFLGN